MPAAQARHLLAAEHIADLRHLDAQLRQTRARLAGAVRECGTSLTEVFGIGPVIAALIIGDVEDIARFASRDAFAACNGTAPIEVSSGNRVIHRLSQRGNRRLNHAIHLAAVTQIRHRHSNGRACYDKKIAGARPARKPCAASSAGSATPSGHTCAPTPGTPPQPARRAREGNRGTTLHPARPAHTPSASSSDQPLPEPGPQLTIPASHLQQQRVVIPTGHSVPFDHSLHTW